MTDKCIFKNSVDATDSKARGKTLQLQRHLSVGFFNHPLFGTHDPAFGFLLLKKLPDVAFLAGQETAHPPLLPEVIVNNRTP